MFIKVCGITNLDDALDAIEFGVDALGFNFYQDSPHYISPQNALKILEDVPPVIQRVGVFVNEREEIVQDLSQILNLDVLQFQGDETPYYCEQFATPYWKGFHLKDEHTLKLMEKYHPEAFLVDPELSTIWGGKGMTAHWDLVKAARERGKIILSGSLNEHNIEMAITTVKPWGVDVCSGIENKPGEKNRARLEEFVGKIRSL